MKRPRRWGPFRRRRHESGNITGFAKVTRDLTERKRNLDLPRVLGQIATPG